MRKALILAATCALASLSCGFEKGGLGTAEAADSGAEDTGSSSDETGVDAPEPPAAHGDPYPVGSIAFFARATCPAEWTPYEPAVGRTIVPTVGETTPGGVNGAPLESGEDRKHTHKWATKFSIPKFSFGTIDGPNDGVGNGGDVAFAGTTEPASSGLPYAQKLVCKKVGARGPKALPAGMQVFFEGGKCPEGFHQTEETQGRVLVGLPKGAGADQTFGAAPMFGTEARKHSHALSATLTTESYGLFVASSCCRDGYARNGTYSATTTTDEGAATLPWIELLSCTKD